MKYFLIGILGLFFLPSHLQAALKELSSSDLDGVKLGAQEIQECEIQAWPNDGFPLFSKNFLFEQMGFMRTIVGNSFNKTKNCPDLIVHMTYRSPKDEALRYFVPDPISSRIQETVGKAFD